MAFSGPPLRKFPIDILAELGDNDRVLVKKEVFAYV